MTTETITYTDPRLHGLEPGSELYRRAERALDAYDKKTSDTRIIECLDAWGDNSLISVEVAPFTADGRTHYGIYNPRPISDVARDYLGLVDKWWEAVETLARDLADGNPALPDALNPLVSREAGAALDARNRVLISWARLTLGAAGPTPANLGGYVEAGGVAVHLADLPL
ncbi:hypothetical protein [Pseudofrankia sp. BMG5.37]|uniref:hypothetical protein n=1 Tax=Pseudofrankia sp. BMG5.37 TaxID=3050035 RepID=UPI0028938923|nr:hypothetical protein [Pseudofrankia sp. BMG5.37]MDT3438356.1 hypothetical protein [Pseudofrankia sp. BMG5.37]